MDLHELSAEDVCELLEDHSVSNKVLDALHYNGVMLTEEEIKELTPKIADRVTVRKIRLDTRNATQPLKSVVLFLIFVTNSNSRIS